MSPQPQQATAFEVDLGRSGNAPNNPVAQRLEAESEKLAEKRQSLTSEAITNKLEAAAEKREQ